MSSREYGKYVYSFDEQEELSYKQYIMGDHCQYTLWVSEVMELMIYCTLWLRIVKQSTPSIENMTDNLRFLTKLKTYFIYSIFKNIHTVKWL